MWRKDIKWTYIRGMKKSDYTKAVTAEDLWTAKRK